MCYNLGILGRTNKDTILEVDLLQSVHHVDVGFITDPQGNEDDAEQQKPTKELI